ncbi:MAG TPA: hypothetical protein VNU92_13115 [Edaphobacter sp.]|jgi:hypothetical protein|nr:hypothetical protein [Edaphobacter sp.]
MKRPIGLILSAIVMSLAALFLLLMTALMAVAGIFSGRQPAIQPEPPFLIYFLFAISFFYAALAVWTILTVIGILRLRAWARYSVLIIGGGLAVLGLLAALFSLVGRTMLPATPSRPPVDPHSMTVIFLFIGAFYLFIAAIGIWWLVYFNLRPVRELFSNPNLLLQSSNPTCRLSHTPTAIKIIGAFLLFSSACCLLGALLPFPAFILGFILPPLATHGLYLAFALVTAFAGYDLLRLKEYARLLTIGLLILGCCNLVLAALPWYRACLHLYVTRLTAQMTSHLPAGPGRPRVDWTGSNAFYLICLVWGVTVYGITFWFLHRHRAAFKTAPQQLLEP